LFIPSIHEIPVSILLSIEYRLISEPLTFYGDHYRMVGTSEIIFILLVVLLLYGGKRLPEFAKSLGQGIREFKKASQGLDEEICPPSPIKKAIPEECLENKTESTTDCACSTTSLSDKK
jgi:sec-independent protein translocase protein TatA